MGLRLCDMPSRIVLMTLFFNSWSLCLVNVKWKSLVTQLPSSPLLPFIHNFHHLLLYVSSFSSLPAFLSVIFSFHALQFFIYSFPCILLLLTCCVTCFHLAPVVSYHAKDCSPNVCPPSPAADNAGETFLFPRTSRYEQTMYTWKVLRLEGLGKRKNSMTSSTQNEFLQQEQV
jgi:hypothetical protein